MSADSYTTEYHLTPRGWIKGSTWYYQAPVEEIAPPLDRIET
jgi:hypothetical protein